MHSSSSRLSRRSLSHVLSSSCSDVKSRQASFLFFFFFLTSSIRVLRVPRDRRGGGKIKERPLSLLLLLSEHSGTISFTPLALQLKAENEPFWLLWLANTNDMLWVDDDDFSSLSFGISSSDRQNYEDHVQHKLVRDSRATLKHNMGGPGTRGAKKRKRKPSARHFKPGVGRP